MILQMRRSGLISEAGGAALFDIFDVKGARPPTRTGPFVEESGGFIWW